MIILVCGGRDYQDRARVFAELQVLNATRGPIHGLVHGAARGADRLAAEWMAESIKAYHRFCDQNPMIRRQCQLWSCGYPAMWEIHGRSAGPKRNQYMLDQNPGIELVVAFPGGSGTADMVRRARAKEIEVIEIK